VVAAAAAAAALAAALLASSGRSETEPEAAQTSFLAGFDPGLLLRGASRDQIPAIDAPRFETPEQAAALLPPESLVVGLELNGDARAYPVSLLSLHEVVNDVVGGEPVAITWCPLCQTALGFYRREGGRVLSFGVSGLLYHANLVLYDRQTNSLWSQLLGGAVLGRYKGTPLRPIPLVLTTWAEWLERYPDTHVLSIGQDQYAGRFLEPTLEAEGQYFDFSNAPYAGYTQKVSAWFRQRHRGVQDGARVLTIALDGQAKAYTMPALRKSPALQDRVAGRPVLVTFDRNSLAASVFSRQVDGRVLDFRYEARPVVDLQTGTRWDPLTGIALAGPLRGERLAQLPSTWSYWFAWRRFHPQTAIVR
jgi:hypothetical protein